MAIRVTYVAPELLIVWQQRFANERVPKGRGMVLCRLAMVGILAGANALRRFDNSDHSRIAPARAAALGLQAPASGRQDRRSASCLT
jgi:hypothetical protein